MKVGIACRRARMFETENGIRIGVSVYNNDVDIDKFLNALGR